MGEAGLSSDRGISRRKDPDVLEMAETLEHLERVVLRYTRSLEDELAGERVQPVPNEALLTGLERMIDLLKSFAGFIDDEVWMRMITVADRSTSHVARRTGKFF